MLQRVLNFINKIITLDGRLLGLELNLAERYKASLFIGRNDGHSVTFSALVTMGAWAVPIGTNAGSIYTYLDLELSLGVITFAVSFYRTNQPKQP
ncbi:hypothetical protein LCGC14_1646630 [marine sediment metagenome]|uniref:Uncharacterized protein n=1 Tax=marine sediment metagenome TaxID=412755 RepID=A0A0F9KDX0_9ZZZZ